MTCQQIQEHLLNHRTLRELTSSFCTFFSFPADMQRTFVAVKPDGVQRGLCGEIIKRFEQRGFRLVAAKFMQVTVATAASPAARSPLERRYQLLLTDMNDSGVFSDQASEEHMKKHYLDLKDKPFYGGLCKYMSSGPVLAMVTHTRTRTCAHTDTQHNVGVSSGVGGAEHCETGPDDAWRDEPS